MTPKIIINGFETGILEDKTIQAKNGFSLGAGLDIIREKGILKVSQKLKRMPEADSPNDITDRIVRILSYYPSGGSPCYYALGSTGKIYKYSGGWTKQHADSITGADEMIVFNGNLYWVTDDYTSSNIGKYDGSTWTDSASFKTGLNAGVEHPMVVFVDTLMIGNGRYVATLDSSENLNTEALDLPSGWEICSLASYGTKVIIGAYKKTSFKGALFSWDGTSKTFDNIWDMGMEIPDAMHNWKNYLIIFSSGVGNIYAFNGATIEKIKSLKFLIPQFYTAIPRKGAIDILDGNLIFGYDASWDYGGIFQLIDAPGLPLILSHIPSVGLKSGSNTTEIWSVFVNGTESFMTGWYQEGAGTGIDTISTTDKISSGAYWESQVYEVSYEENPVPIRGIELIAKPMASGTSVIVKYKKNNASSWSTWGTINSSNQNHAIIKGIGLAKTIQIRLEFTCSGNNSPEIQAIKIY